MVCPPTVFLRNFRFPFTRPRPCVTAISNASVASMITLKVLLTKLADGDGPRRFGDGGAIFRICIRRIERDARWLNEPNAPIQGSAADIVKMAMLDVHKQLKDSGLKSRMLVQIHDELLFDVAPGEEEKLRQLVREGMEGVMSLRVPLEVAIGFGPTWKDAAH